MKTNKYGKKVWEFFSLNSNLVYSIINKIIINYYSIPINVDDVYYHVIYCFTNVDYETMYYKKGIDDINKFILSQLKFLVYEYCNSFTTKKYKIMNNYVSFDESDIIDNISCDSTYYIYSDLFGFLTDDEFEIIYQLKVLKINKKDIAKKHNINLSKLRDIEYKIMSKIKHEFS